MGGARAARTRTIFRAHLWLGTLAALPLLVVAGTGAVLGFYDPLRHAAAPHRLPHRVERRMATAELVAAVRSRFPHHRLDRLRLPRTDRTAALAHLSGPDRRTLFLHPASGAILAETNGEPDWLETIHRLHHGKPFGETGRTIATLSAVVALILFALGARLRANAPRRAPLRPGAGLRARLLAFHRPVAWAVGIPVVVLAVTGGLLNYAGPLRNAFLADPVAGVGETPPADPAHVLRVGEGAYGGAPLDRVDFPSGGDTPVRFRFVDGSWAYVDAARGSVLEVRPVHSHWLLLLYPVHSGRILGLVGPVLVATLGVAIFLAIVSGTAYHAHRRRNGRARPSSDPPKRSAAR
jgi:uncharacterized iron-regulated membrane protein